MVSIQVQGEISYVTMVQVYASSTDLEEVDIEKFLEYPVDPLHKLKYVTVIIGNVYIRILQ